MKMFLVRFSVYLSILVLTAAAIPPLTPNIIFRFSSIPDKYKNAKINFGVAAVWRRHS